MAQFNVVNLEGVMSDIQHRSDKAIAKVPKMLKAGAAVLVEAQKMEAKTLDIEDTGDFIRSIKATKVKKDSSGNDYIEVLPSGKDRKNVSNAEKGFIAEYGRQGDKHRTKSKNRSDSYTYGLLAPRPWMSAANEKSAEAVNEAMLEVWMEDDDDG